MDQIFLQRYTRNFEIRRRVLRVKKNDEIQNEHISLSLSLSLYLSICRCTLIFPKGCACTSLSLSFSLHLHLQKRFRSRSDPNGIQERMFRQLKMYSCAIESTQSVVQKPMRTIKWVLRVYIVRSHTRIQRGEFLSNTGPYPLKFSKYKASIQRWAIIGTPVKRHLKPLSLKKEDKKRCQSSDPDQIRMDFRKECFVNLNIWACDRKHA